MAGMPAKAGTFSLVDLDYVGIKVLHCSYEYFCDVQCAFLQAPQFSFTRLQGADPTLGVEMMSTGEVWLDRPTLWL
jgi:hypothetical protein